MSYVVPHTHFVTTVYHVSHITRFILSLSLYYQIIMKRLRGQKINRMPPFFLFSVETFIRLHDIATNVLKTILSQRSVTLWLVCIYKPWCLYRYCAGWGWRSWVKILNSPIPQWVLGYNTAVDILCGGSACSPGSQPLSFKTHTSCIISMCHQTHSEWLQNEHFTKLQSVRFSETHFSLQAKSQDWLRDKHFCLSCQRILNPITALPNGHM